ncbi:uncharacterized protein EV420DRAFT_753485 [Desarmillaria tabescens]|uniref:Glycoside hydrolase family 43 protein n=1 Tax=Armillaria tabescens TaxID=1929756 RepID=A0AA39JX71_ARMTA|nr:uncharacterized protein EV420DRAFT_753485 [Desarmillaria tabescens]KAK0450413.1 hypothetical protein EV420DRAFT_753485 [Desarmillaria tabescens]
MMPIMIATLLALLCFCPMTVLSADTLGIKDGFTTFNTGTFTMKLIKDSQTLYSLMPTGSSFDFMPSDYMAQRADNGQNHVGDINIRARRSGTSAWTTISSVVKRSPVTALSVSGTTIAAANLAPTLNSTLLGVTRSWSVEDGILQLRFNISNPQSQAVEIGALGAPLEFNSIFTGRTVDATNNNCSLIDPYIGQDAGFVQVTPLLGTLRPLVLIPAASSPFEGWHFLPEVYSDSSYDYQSQTFEGFYEWQFHTLAFAQNEWASVTPWNSPTSFTLQPGQSRTYGLKFLLADSIRGIENTLISAGHPVAAGIPGYILPTDQTGKLFLNYRSAVTSISVTPSGALSWTSNSEAKTSGWVGYNITPRSWGRSRLSITYADSTLQTINYYVTHDAVQVLSDLGNFLTTNQWFNDTSDPFGRAPSVISYDREVNAIVKDDPRAWIPGLSDEAGAGSWLAAAMKQYLQPNAAEVAKMEQFMNKVVKGLLQNSDGTVKKSVYYYQPALVPSYNYPTTINWGNWWSWNRAASYDTSRGYDYVHVIAAHWAMYRVARNYPALVSLQNSTWYLDQALAVVTKLTDGTVGYWEDGLMGETVLSLLLDDLTREGRTSDASLLKSRMQTRYNVWSRQSFPFGSEMAWDSTGQEGVYLWSKYFGGTTLATKTLNSILAYQPLIPHWGYNGNARRYWDNIYGGKLQRIERQIHHYGSGLNALPLISEFTTSPTDFFLLRLGYAGLSGPMSNIDQGGFASASFHSWADTLKWDGYSGDYGPNFSGHSMGIGMYLIEHPDFGWQAFGGTVTSSSSSSVQVQVKDTGRRKVFIAPIAAMLKLDAGAFTGVTYDPAAHTVVITIANAVGSGAAAPHGRLVVSQTVSGQGGVGVLVPTKSLSVDAGAYTIPFSGSSATVTLSP